MKQTLKRLVACVLTLCMVFCMEQFPAFAETAAAAAADGEIDSSVEGFQTLRYYTTDSETGTAITSPVAKNEHLEDFFLGTESFTYSVQFKTGNAKLQALLSLEDRDHYMAFYVLNGTTLGMETKLGSGKDAQAANGLSINDNQWHTAELKMVKGKSLTLSLDGTVVKTEENPSWTVKTLGWTPTAFTIGGMTAYSSASGWTADANIRNVVLTREYHPSNGAQAVWSQQNPGSEAMNTGVETFTDGALQFTYRLKSSGSAEHLSLLSLADEGEVFINTAADAGKLCVQPGGSQTPLEVPVANTGLATEKWHNAALAVDGTALTVYVDGKSAGSVTLPDGGINVSSLQCGSDVYVSGISLYDSAPGEGDIAEWHEATLSDDYPDRTETSEGYFKGPNREIFNAGFDGSHSYRIPALVTSKKTGTVFASIDKRWYTNADVGVNDTVVRRSTDNGDTWGPVIPVIDLSDDDGYTIDPALIVDNQSGSEHYGRVYLLVDMQPYGKSLWNLTEGTGYKKIDGVDYQILKDAQGNEYTIRENGIVYDSNNEKTSYQVETEPKAPYKDYGMLYKDGVKIGNIFRQAELTMEQTGYLWFTYSDDDGLTWSLPKDITPMVKEDWMTFIGTGPGAGVQLQNGRLVFTTYCMDKNNRSARFSSFHVYSDDDGETWHRGGSPNDRSETETIQNSERELNESCIVELNNGHLIQFMKNATPQVAMSVSSDRGQTWGEVTYAEGIAEVYCEMSAVHYPEKIVDPRDGQAKEAIIFSNPGGPGRTHGKVRIAFVNEDDTLDWAYEKLIDDGSYLYSSLTVMNDGNIGLIYENEKVAGHTAAAFTSFSPQYIMDGNPFVKTPVPETVTAEVRNADGTEKADGSAIAQGDQILVSVQFDQKVFAAGNVTADLEIGGEKREAQLVGNTSADTLQFLYTVAAKDQGNITAYGAINIKEGGAAENIYNICLVDCPLVTASCNVGKIGTQFPALSPEGMTATAGSEYATSGNEGPASNVLDGNVGTWWHNNYSTENAPEHRSKHWVSIQAGSAPILVTELLYTPRQGNNNGIITEYQIEVSNDGETYTPISRGTWAKNSEVKSADFGGAVVAKYVRLRVLDSGDKWASAAEIRLVGTTDTTASADKTALLAQIMAFDSISGSTLEEYASLVAALGEAKLIASDLSASAADVNRVLADLDSASKSAISSAKEGLAQEIENEIPASERGIYTISSWSNYAQALADAKASVDLPGAEALNAYITLTETRENLTFTKGALENVKDACKKALEAANAITNQQDYTAASWKTFSDARQALANAEDETDLVVLNHLVTNLLEAKEGLVTLALEKAIAARTQALEAANAITNQQDYTVESWKTFSDARQALTDAENVKDADELNRLVTALTEAQDGLITLLQEARDARTQALKAANAITNEQDYTVESWKTFSDARQALTDAENVTDAAELHRLVNTLKTAQDALQLKGIETIDLAKCTLSLESSTYIYNGKAQKPGVTVKNGTSVVPSGSYDVSYTGNTNAGTATVTVTARADSGYTGSASTTFVINPKSISKVTVSLSKTSFNWNGKTQKPIVTVTDGAKLKSGSDYTAVYPKTTKNAGSYQVEVKGKGNYTGTIKKAYTITVTKGKTYTVSGIKYKVTSATAKTTAGTGTVTLTGTANKKLSSVTIKDTVKLGGRKYKVTEIGANAFQKYKKLKKVVVGKNVTKIGKGAFDGCKKLTTLKIQGTSLKAVGKNAIRGINKKATIKVPSKKIASYKKLFKASTGYKKTMKIKK